MDIRGWLERLGLGQYADTFVANHIDATLLGTLTADDLRELGIDSVGHRKRLLAAIAAFEQAPAAGPAAEADRRQVAVLFADLCGFTELSARIGAEDVRIVVEKFLARADEVVAEFGGSVDKHIGDAVMALFGAPVAHEDDCWRAVSAADALQRSMPALSTHFGRPLATHVGIALGEVVAGEIGGSVRRDYTVLGDTVNLAARLVAVAGPGEILLSDPAARVLAGRVRLVDAGLRGATAACIGCRLVRRERGRSARPASRSGRRSPGRGGLSRGERAAARIRSDRARPPARKARPRARTGGRAGRSPVAARRSSDVGSRRAARSLEPVS
ncbi:adenylate/guanylate cyclase domain-containing protein [Enhydrobacter sp.]|jgi:class 3 adenylate cyclase|uniref:adenylate/guanylate cyclase domain-containing protein n=1 Tax=Enhydrobacter sp. TaxID=1894999 RepID=UPI002636D9D4|nr:adenylate/guanylate cyclase domain-containing protein [Enhydrobacter sp.]